MARYAKQALWEAVSALAEGHESLQVRLAVAAGSRGTGLVKIAHDFETQLPLEQHEEFRSLWSTLGGGSSEDTCNKLSNQEAQRLASRIVGLFVDIMGGL